MEIVDVVAYDPAWPGAFLAEREALTHAVPGALTIEHIGSTSVPGMAARPIIDIQVVVPDLHAVLADLAPLQRLGYRHRPDAFPDHEEHEFLAKDTAGLRTHHLHLFGVTSPLPEANRTFRDYLAAHPDAARRYESAKRRAADLHPDSRARYGDAKRAMTAELKAEARRWHESRRRDDADGGAAP